MTNPKTETLGEDWFVPYLYSLLTGCENKIYREEEKVVKHIVYSTTD